MRKLLSAIFLLAGTAIGSGMISLPIVLAPLGIVPIIGLTLLFAGMTYLSALVRVELNLQSESDFTLEDVGRKFSGKTAALVGNISLKILSLALLSAYIYGLGAMMPFPCAKLLIGLAVGIAFVYSSDKIIRFNDKAFVFLLVVVLAIIVGSLFQVDLRALPQSPSLVKVSKLCILFPTLFTSFGFQGSLHVLTKFCHNDRKMIVRACFWGSLIPAVVYLAWTLCMMAIIFNTQPQLFAKMAREGIDVAELIAALGAASGEGFTRCAVLVLSVGAIATSIFGVGIALVEDIERTFCRLKVHLGKKSQRCAASCMAALPATFVAISIPEAFIKVLGFAGMILTIIALLLPAFLLRKIHQPKHIQCLEHRSILYALVTFAAIIIVCEIASLMKV